MLHNLVKKKQKWNELWSINVFPHQEEYSFSEYVYITTCILYIRFDLAFHGRQKGTDLPKLQSKFKQFTMTNILQKCFQTREKSQMLSSYYIYDKRC